MTPFEKYINTKFSIDASYYLRGGFWLFVNQFVSIVGGVGVSAIFAYLLSEADYGTYRYLLGMGMFLSVFSLTGMRQSVFQAAAKQGGEFYMDGIKISLFYGLGITISSLIGSMYYYINDNSLLAIGLLLIAFLQPVVNAYQNIFSFLQGSSQFKESTKLQAIKTLVISTVSISVVFISQNILLLVATYLILHAATNLVSHLFYKPNLISEFSDELQKKYLNFAKHTSLRNIISGIAFRLDTIIVFTQLGALDLATYTIALLVPEQIKGAIKNIATLVLPKYAQHNNLDVIKRSIPLRCLQLLFIFSITAILYALIAPYIYGLIFPKYDSAVLFSQLLALSFPAMVAILPYNALQSQLKEVELYYFSVVNSVVTIALTITLITTFGLLGAIWAKILSRYTILVLTFFLLYRK